MKQLTEGGLTEEERRNVERYENLYKKFIDKTRGREKIPMTEYFEIQLQIYEENPEFRGCVFTAAVDCHGWRPVDIREDDKINSYMIKRKEWEWE